MNNTIPWDIVPNISPVMELDGVKLVRPHMGRRKCSKTLNKVPITLNDAHPLPVGLVPWCQLPDGDPSPPSVESLFISKCGDFGNLPPCVCRYDLNLVLRHAHYYLPYI